MSYGEFLDHLFELKFAAKQLERSAANSEKQESVEKNKLTQAIKVTRFLVLLFLYCRKEIWK